MADSNRCPAEDLINALRLLDYEDYRSQAADMRKILRLLTKLCEVGGAVTLIPFVVTSNGVLRLGDVLRAINKIDEASEDRWSLLEHLIDFLDVLLIADMTCNKFGTALQAKLRTT